jgi:hypothetical protein
LQQLGRKSPLEILIEYAPTMEKMIEERDKEWNHAVHLASGEFKINSQTISLENFSTQYDACPQGRLFDRYPDQVKKCRVFDPTSTVKIKIESKNKIKNPFGTTILLV